MGPADRGHPGRTTLGEERAGGATMMGDEREEGKSVLMSTSIHSSACLPIHSLNKHRASMVFAESDLVLTLKKFISSWESPSQTNVPLIAFDSPPPRVYRAVFQSS